MDPAEQLAAEILDDIRSGRDLWIFDHYVDGPDRLANARRLLLEQQAAAEDPVDRALLAGILQHLDQSKV